MTTTARLSSAIAAPSTCVAWTSWLPRIVACVVRSSQDQQAGRRQDGLSYSGAGASAPPGPIPDGPTPPALGSPARQSSYRVPNPASCVYPACRVEAAASTRSCFSNPRYPAYLSNPGSLTREPMGQWIPRLTGPRRQSLRRLSLEPVLLPHHAPHRYPTSLLNVTVRNVPPTPTAAADH